MNGPTHPLLAPGAPSSAVDARSARGWVRSCRVAFGASVALLLASGAACGNDEAAPAPIATPDAGTACEAGSEGCACVFGSGCQQGLLCISRRCLLADATPEMMQERPPRPAPPLPNPPAPEPAPDGGGPAAPSDAGVEDTPPDAGPPPDASADAG